MWSAFIATTLITWIVYLNAWMTGSYFLFLVLLGIVAFSLAVMILIRTKFSWRIALFVALILLVGQWWMIEAIVAQLSFGRSGFAP
jgi:hypothetical protein